MPDETAQAFESHDPSRRAVLAVVRREGGTEAAELLKDHYSITLVITITLALTLKDGDIINRIEGERVNSYRELEQSVNGKETVAVEVIRYGEILSLNLPTVVVDGTKRERVVGWAGTLLQDVPMEVRQQHGTSGCGVYVAAHMPGSPATRSDLPPTTRIIEVS